MKESLASIVKDQINVDTGGSRVLGIRSDTFETLLRVFHRDPKAKLGFIIVALFVLMAVFAPELAPYDPMSQDFQTLQPPSIDHPIGTDSFGRDLLSRIMYGARISLGVALGAVLFGGVTGITLGLVAGYYGGFVDDVLMRMVDTVWAFPYLLMAIIFTAIMGNGWQNVVLALGLAFIDDFARVVRGEVLAQREEEYVMSAESIGESNFSIMFREIFPNTIGPMIVQATILTARAILGESTLSFLGLGVKPTTPTWGALLGQGRSFLYTAWWIAIPPGVMIFIAVFGIHLFGDALRDAYDVKRTD